LKKSEDAYEFDRLSAELEDLSGFRVIERLVWDKREVLPFKG
jgi:hypothetical protein